METLKHIVVESLKTLAVLSIVITASIIGVLILAAIPEHHCPACGSEVVKGQDKFCSQCGLQLDSTLRYNDYNIPKQFKKQK